MKTLFNKIVHFEWDFCGTRYRINWPAVIIIGGGFTIVGLYQHYWY